MVGESGEQRTGRALESGSGRRDLGPEVFGCHAVSMPLDYGIPDAEDERRAIDLTAQAGTSETPMEGEKEAVREGESSAMQGAEECTNGPHGNSELTPEEEEELLADPEADQDVE